MTFNRRLNRIAKELNLPPIDFKGEREIIQETANSLDLTIKQLRKQFNKIMTDKRLKYEICVYFNDDRQLDVDNI